LPRLEIFRRKTAAEKNSHASRVVILLARSSAKMLVPVRLELEDAAVWQVWFALRLMTAAESSVRDRRNRAEKHRLPSRL